MDYEFFPYPGCEVPVTINGKYKGRLLKLVFDVSDDYPLNHKKLVPDMINHPVVLDIHKDTIEHVLEPERLGRYESETFRFKYVVYTTEEWHSEIYYRWKWEDEEARYLDLLDLCRKL